MGAEYQQSPWTHVLVNSEELVESDHLLSSAPFHPYPLHGLKPGQGVEFVPSSEVPWRMGPKCPRLLSSWLSAHYLRLLDGSRWSWGGWLAPACLLSHPPGVPCPTLCTPALLGGAHLATPWAFNTTPPLFTSVACIHPSELNSDFIPLRKPPFNSPHKAYYLRCSSLPQASVHVITAHWNHLFSSLP